MEKQGCDASPRTPKKEVEGEQKKKTEKTKKKEKRQALMRTEAMKRWGLKSARFSKVTRLPPSSAVV